MLAAVLGTVAGLVVLTLAADAFVVGAVRLANHWRVSTVVVGAVVIGFGTSAPELVVSYLAATQGSLDLAVGNIVGSNIANLSLVLGAAAVVTPVVVRSQVLRREAPLSLLLVIVFGLVVQGGIVGWEGFVLAALLIGSLTIIVRSAREGDPTITAEVEAYVSTEHPRVGIELVRTTIGLLGTLGGAQLLIVSVTTISEELGLAQGFIGLTIVAIGTSLPELATCLQAARRRQTGLIVGNLLGSNLFNSGAVGASAALGGVGQVADPGITGLGVVLMIALATVATGFMVTGLRVVRLEGIGLLVAYAAVIPLLA
ncbi:MAG: sodium:calcium antiporter [Actinomycetota bacterium]